MAPASPWYAADLAITGDTIVRIAPAITEPAKRVVNVKGLIVAPGFIDIHTHARRGIFEVPTADNYVRQGVTTLIEGPDGGSPIPLAPFLDKVAATRITPNFAMFIGQGSVRSEVMGEVDRPATRDELEKMRALVTQGMEEGAFGLSSGLFYVPGAFTPTEEVIELARVAGSMGGIYISHMRDEAKGLTDSVRETIAIGEKGGLPTQITHHKVVGKKYWGGSVQTLRMVDEARARGVDATIDQYPYTASATSIGAALLPAWAKEGGRERTLKRSRIRRRARRSRRQASRSSATSAAAAIRRTSSVSACQFDPKLAGQEPRADHAGPRPRGRRSRTPPRRRCGSSNRAVAAASSTPSAKRICSASSRTRRRWSHPTARCAVFGRNVPHPRSYGTFARVLGLYVRDKKVLRARDRGAEDVGIAGAAARA